MPVHVPTIWGKLLSSAAAGNARMKAAKRLRRRDMGGAPVGLGQATIGWGTTRVTEVFLGVLRYDRTLKNVVR